MTERQIKDLNYIKDRVEFYTGLDIRKKTREREYVYARMVFCKIIREEFLMTMDTIGKYLGKSHCTIVHYMKNFDTIEKYEYSFNKVYQYILLEMDAEQIFIGKKPIGERKDINKDILEARDKIQKAVRTAVKEAVKEYEAITN
jgi:predicted transcriptional regulator